MPAVSAVDGHQLLIKLDQVQLDIRGGDPPRMDDAENVGASPHAVSRKRARGRTALSENIGLLDSYKALPNESPDGKRNSVFPKPSKGARDSLFPKLKCSPVR